MSDTTYTSSVRLVLFFAVVWLMCKPDDTRYAIQSRALIASSKS